MKTRKSVIILFSIAAVLICAFFLLRGFSFQLALGLKGYDTETAVFFHGFDSQRREYQVIQTENREGSPAILQMKKGALGFWRVVHSREGASPQDKMLLSFWFGDTKLRSGPNLIPGQPVVSESEAHYAYYGENAVGLIEFRPGQLPEHTAVSIQQAGERYWIHLILFTEDVSSADMDLFGILLENGCIE